MHIKDYLFNNNISHREFAESIGYSRGSFCRIVNGHYVAPMRLRILVQNATDGQVNINEWPFELKKTQQNPNQLLLFAEAI